MKTVSFCHNLFFVFSDCGQGNQTLGKSDIMADKKENVRTTLMYFVISVESTHCNKDV